MSAMLERLGVCNVRSREKDGALLYWGVPTERFWETWRAQKDALKSQGVWVSKTDDGNWMVFQKVAVPSATAQSYAVETDLDVPVPAGKALLPYQRAGIAYMLAHPRTLLADPMGLGKTVQAIGLMNMLPEARRILVIAPAGLRLNWAREVRAWDVHGRDVMIALDDVPRRDGVIITNYDRLAKLHAALARETWDLIVLDEAHYLKNPDAQRTRLVFGHGRRVQGLRAERWLSLTGTPILNRPAELWTHVRAYDPNDLGRDWRAYHVRYCAARQQYIGGRWVWDISGASNLEELRAKLRSKFLLRREKDEVLRDLPEKRRQVIVVEPEDSATTASVDAERQIVERLVRDYGDVVEALKNPRVFAEFDVLARLRRENALAKAPYVARHVADGLEDPNQKAVVFTWHRDVAETIAAQLNAMLRAQVAVAVHGDHDDRERQAMVDAFQRTDSPRVIVATMKALGVGYTLTRADWAVFAELSWTPADVEQAEDRLHRIGQRSSVLVQHIVFDGTVDALIARSMARKSEIIAAVMR